MQSDIFKSKAANRFQQDAARKKLGYSSHRLSKPLLTWFWLVLLNPNREKIAVVCDSHTPERFIQRSDNTRQRSFADGRIYRILKTEFSTRKRTSSMTCKKFLEHLNHNLPRFFKIFLQILHRAFSISIGKQFR